jgi:CHAD domain-containing protein
MVVGPDVTAGDLIRVAIARSVVDLLDNLALAREDRDPEGVHQARVAIRMIRSNLQTFESVLDREWAVAVRSDLAPLGLDLGRVRDDDVLDGRLMRLARSHPEIANEHLSQLRSVLAAQTLRDRMALIDRLDGAPTARLLGRLVAEAADLPVAPAGDTPARNLLEPVLRKNWRKLEKAVDALPVNPELDDLHRIRILTKRVRYAAEAVTPAYGRKAKRFAGAAAILQDDLGELNDAAVTRAWLSEVSPLLTGPAAFAAGGLSQQLAIESRERARVWRKTYGSLDKRFDAWLG